MGFRPTPTKSIEKIKYDIQFTLRFCTAFQLLCPVVMVLLYVYDFTNVGSVVGAMVSLAFTALIMWINAPDLWFLRRGPIVEIRDVSKADDIMEWLEYCCPGRFKMLNQLCIKFYNKRDLTSYMLMWK